MTRKPNIRARSHGQALVQSVALIALVALVVSWMPLADAFRTTITGSGEATAMAATDRSESPALASFTQAAVVSPLARLGRAAGNAYQTAKALATASNRTKVAGIYAAENWKRVRRFFGGEQSLMDGADPTTLRTELLQVAADTETTGFPDNPDTRILSLGGVKHQGGKVTQQGAKQWLFNPGEDALEDFLRIKLDGQEAVLVPVDANDVTQIAKSTRVEELPPSAMDAIRARLLALGIEPGEVTVGDFELTREPAAVHIHGITWDLLKNYPSFADQLEEINEFFMNAHPQGYNANYFDRELIIRELHRVPAEQRPKKLAPVFDEDLAWIDTLDRAYSGLVDRAETGGRLKLDRIAPYLGIELEQHPTPTLAALEEGIMAAHSAIGDAEATRRVDDIFFAKVEADRGRTMTYKEMMQDQWKRRASLRYAVERAHRGY